MGDPVGDGLVASLARPGGNTTGLTFLGPQLVPKRLALLKEALPAAYGVAALWHPGAYGVRTMDDMMNEAEGAAQTLGLQLRLFGVREPDELDKAFSAIADERADALIVFPSPMLFAERKRVVDLATKLRLPLISMGKEFVQLGGLMSYGADITDLFRLSGAYVDKVLKGAKPSRFSSPCLGMISAQTLRVCREGKPVPTFPDHALIGLRAICGESPRCSAISRHRYIRSLINFETARRSTSCRAPQAATASAAGLGLIMA